MRIVAPYTGAWIEINIALHISAVDLVAPYTGAWIEIYKYHLARVQTDCRPLYGGVD